MNMLKINIILIFVCFLVGCAGAAKNYLPDQLIEQKNSKLYLTEEHTIDISKIDVSKYSGAAKQSERNDIIASMISLSDEKCAVHKAEILANSNTWNIVTGTGAILFSASAAVIGHAQTAAELASGASAVSGIQSLVNTEVYADVLGTTVLRSIDVAREKSMAVIEVGLKDPTYSLPQAYIDIQKYHYSCSFMAGIVEVTKAIENRQQSSNEIERDIQKLKQSLTSADSDFSSLSESDRNAIKSKYAEKIQKLTLSLSKD